MLVIGLTGGIGSGKTLVSKLFAEHGVPIIDADIIARQLTEPSQSAFDQIVQYFGNEILNADGSLNRKQLRSIIFKNTEQRLWLENLLHPLILKEMVRQVSRLTTNTPYCLVVIPLLFETESNQSSTFVDRILLIDSSEQNQLLRVSERDKSVKAEVLSILQNQAKREHRLAKADDVIINDGLISDLEPQVEHLHQKYINLAKAVRSENHKDEDS